MLSEDTPRVTVILPTFNRDRYIGASLESILEQSVRPYQIIVVNDGSTDATEEVLSPFLSQITYCKKENGGKPAAINSALPLVEGDYIWVFDDDDVACPDALARHLDVLERRPEVGFTFSSTFFASSHPDNGWLCVERELRPRAFPEEDFLAELLLESYTASPAVVVRASVQRAAGLYNEQLIRSQDWEMSLRWGLIAPGARLPDPRPTYYRRFHPGPRGREGEQFADSERVRRGRETNRNIFRRVADYIELKHYLPYPLWEDTMDTPRTRMALSRRLAVRLRKGLWAEAVSDLDALARIGFDKAGPTPEEASFLIRGLAHGDAIREIRAAALEKEIRRRLTLPGMRPVQRLISRGVYYKLRADLMNRSWNEIRATASVLCRLLDARGAVEQLARRPIRSREGTQPRSDTE